MAFSQSNSRGNSNGNSKRNIFLFHILNFSLYLFVELQNRKILEELQLKKQMLLKQGVAPSLNTSLGVSSTGSASSIVSIDVFLLMTVKGISLIYHIDTCCF